MYARLRFSASKFSPLGESARFLPMEEAELNNRVHSIERANHVARLLCHAIFWLVAVGVFGSPVFAHGCRSAGIVFAFDGTFFTTSRDASLSKLASGFLKPQDVFWAPGCGHFAFIDSGSLWVARRNQEPKKVPVPGRVSDYSWSTNGTAIALTVQRTACGQPGRNPVGDVFVFGVSEPGPRELTHDCRSFQLGWSSDDRQLLIFRKVTYELPCDPSTPPCAGSDLVILNIASKSERTLLTVKTLTYRGYSVGSLVHWDSRRHTIYMSNAISPFYGNSRVLVALRDTDGKQLWAHEGEHAQWTRSGAIELWELVGSDQGLVFRLAFFSPQGKRINKYPVGRDWPSDLRFSVLTGPGSKGQRTFAFTTLSGAKLWSFSLPHDLDFCEAPWTPSNTLLVKAFNKNIANHVVEESLWLLDPRMRNATEIFHGNLSISPNSRGNAQWFACNPSLPGVTISEWQ